MSNLLYFNSLSVPFKIVPRATLGTCAAGCRAWFRAVRASKDSDHAWPEVPQARTLCTVKGRAIPLQALTGPEGSRRFRLPDFKTIGTWSWQVCQPYAPATFTPSKYPWYSFLLEAESPHGHSAAGRIMSMKNTNGQCCCSKQNVWG
jgi:hypothetical protein